MRWWAVAALWANVCTSLPPFQTLRKHLPSQSYCWYFTKDSHSSAPLVGWRSTVVMLPPLFMTQDCRTLGMIYTNTCETLWAITGKFTLFFHYKQFLMCLVKAFRSCRGNYHISPFTLNFKRNIADLQKTAYFVLCFQSPTNTMFFRSRTFSRRTREIKLMTFVRSQRADLPSWSVLTHTLCATEQKENMTDLFHFQRVMMETHYCSKIWSNFE